MMHDMTTCVIRVNRQMPLKHGQLIDRRQLATPLIKHGLARPVYRAGCQSETGARAVVPCGRRRVKRIWVRRADRSRRTVGRANNNKLQQRSDASIRTLPAWSTLIPARCVHVPRPSVRRRRFRGSEVEWNGPATNSLPLGRRGEHAALSRTCCGRAMGGVCAVAGR